MIQMKLEPVPLNVFSGSCTPNHSGCKAKNVLGSRYSLSLLQLFGPVTVMGWFRLLEEFVALKTRQGEGVLSVMLAIAGFLVMSALPPPSFRSFLEDLLRPECCHL